jgi:prepilin-type N-terminal cleavage/methylation domain-containing protein
MQQKDFVPCNNNIRGFTLIELLVVLALIAILATILIVVIRPGQIFMRGRDAQRQGDLRNLSAAADAYLSEMAMNSNLSWPVSGKSCSNIFFSVTTTAGSAPTGWPVTTTATGTNSTNVNGTGWVPLDFTSVSILNLNQLPLDPRNDLNGTDATGGSVKFAYSFACSPNFNYEFAAKLEGNTSLMKNDGGNQNNCDTATSTCLYEVGPGRNTLY